MGYFTDSIYEKMMTSRPDRSNSPVRRSRREMMMEYQNHRECLGSRNCGSDIEKEKMERSCNNGYLEKLGT